MNKEDMDRMIEEMMQALDEKRIENLRATYYSDITGKTLEVNEYDLSGNEDDGIML